MMRHLASKGNCAAEWHLGNYYRHGVEGLVVPDLQEAIRWYKSSASKMYGNALKSLLALQLEGKVQIHEIQDLINRFPCDGNTDPELFWLLNKTQWNKGRWL